MHFIQVLANPFGSLFYFKYAWSVMPAKSHEFPWLESWKYGKTLFFHCTYYIVKYYNGVFDDICSLDMTSLGKLDIISGM